MSLVEIASALSITPERARQLEANGLRKLRRHMTEHGLLLKDFIE